MTDRQIPSATTVSPVPLHESVVFLARFLGTPVQVERLRDSLASHGLDGAGLPGTEALVGLLQHAGLVASALPAGAARRPTELPALLVGEGGRCLVALSLKDGRFECHLPGIEGSSWLGADALALEVPAALWLAVRPALHFDARSLLYTLPQPGRWF